MDRTRSGDWSTLGPIYLSIFVTALGVGLVSPLVPRLVGSTGVSNLVVGLTASVMFASFVLTAWPLGMAIDRWGIRRFLISGLAAYAIAIGLMPWSNNLATFFVLRALEGVGWAGVWIATETYVSWVSPDERRGRNMALYSVALAMGTSSGPLIGYKLYERNEALPFLLNVILVLIVIVLVALLVREPEHHHEQISHPPIDAGMSEQGLHLPHGRPERKQALDLLPLLALPLSIAWLYGYGVASMVSLLPVSRASAHEVSLLMTTTIISSVLAQLPIGYLTDRYGRRRVLKVSLLLLLLAAAMASFDPPFRMLLVLGALMGGLAGSLYPVGLSLLGDRIAPRQLGLANGLFSVSYGIGSVIGPAATGWGMSYFGPNALFGSLGLLGACLLAALLLGLGRVPKLSAAQQSQQ